MAHNDYQIPPDTATAGSLLRFQARAAGRWGLAPRQARCLYWLCAGYTSDKALGEHVGLTHNAVKQVFVGVYVALGVPSRTQAVLAAWPQYRAALLRTVGAACGATA